MSRLLKQQNTRENILSVLNQHGGKYRLVDFHWQDWKRIGEMENDELVALVHNARRAQDMVHITDKGRAALEGA